ncbi:MAG TPA: DUF4230 domain-containing protein [Thermoanaerobaculia bacterium]|jgi:Protein of unknown function (DUF4230)
MRSLTRLLLAFAAVVAILAAVGAGYWIGARTRPADALRVDSAPVVRAIRSVAKMATVEIEVADVIRYEEVRTIVVFDVPKNATLRLRGTVLGGFDLESGFSVNVEEATRTLRVRLPAPRILSVDSRVEWFDERSGWLNPITPDDRTRWMTWSRGAIGKAAKDAGIEERAVRHARELLDQVASAFGWKAVVEVGLESKPKL